ncbi:MAG: hypothetical protein F4X02_17765 [Chloroflexi bacterium]|nr:hypothetical protein [Chloroflexota bacterium]
MKAERKLLAGRISYASLGCDAGKRVGVAVGVNVAVGVFVAVGVLVLVAVAVAVAVGVLVGVDVGRTHLYEAISDITSYS